MTNTIATDTRIESIPCRKCGHPTGISPGPFAPAKPLCGECVQVVNSEREAKQRQAANLARRQAVEAARADLRGALMAAGVPERWADADFADAPDLPAGLVERLQAWATCPLDSMMLVGTPGAAKTWSAVAMLRYALAEGVRLPSEVVFACERGFLDWRRGRLSERPASVLETAGSRHPYRARLLLFDDLGASRQTAWSREEISSLVEHRHAERLATIWTSNLGLDELAEAIDGRVASRLAEGAAITFPSRDLRVSGSLD
jgi:DNA replication protein DnaC